MTKPKRKESTAKPSEKSYKLTLTRMQASIIQAALDLYFRIGMGQIDEIAIHLRMRAWKPGYDENKYCAAVKAIEAAKILLFNFPPHANGASHSIYSTEIHDDYRIAWDVMRVIRNYWHMERIATEEKAYTGVDAYDVTASSKEPLAKMSEQKP